MTKRGNTYAKRELKPLERVETEPGKHCDSCLGILDKTSETISTKSRSTTWRCRGCQRRFQWKRPR